VFCYSDLVVYFLLGGQWTEASDFIGLWGLTSCLMIVLAHYCSEVYRSKGKPKLSVLAQWLHMIVLIPVVYWSLQFGYETLYISRSLVRLEGILVNLGLMFYCFKISPLKMIYNVYPEFIACSMFFLCSYIFRYISDSIIFQFLSALLASILYFATLCFFNTERKIIFSFINKLLRNKKNLW